MAAENTTEVISMERQNAISVLKKILVGSFVITAVGVCAFLCLALLMMFI